MEMTLLFKIETTGSGQLDIDGSVTSTAAGIDIDSTGVLPSIAHTNLLLFSSEITETLDAQAGTVTIDSAGHVLRVDGA